MLEETAVIWKRKAKQEGQREVLCAVGASFGPLSEDVRHRVEEIQSTRRLNQLADKILTAGSLREIGPLRLIHPPGRALGLEPVALHLDRQAVARQAEEAADSDLLPLVRRRASRIAACSAPLTSGSSSRSKAASTRVVAMGSLRTVQQQATSTQRLGRRHVDEVAAMFSSSARLPG